MRISASLLRRVGRRQPVRRDVWKPLSFPKDEIVSIPTDERIEEEALPGYTPGRYYPVRIGEMFQDRYQVVGKLGFGAASTVWLARDLDKRRHVALKLYIRSEAMAEELDTELDVYNRIKSAAKDHPGHSAVRSLLDSFDMDRPSGARHRCLVHTPLWDSVLNIKNRNAEFEKEQLNHPSRKKVVQETGEEVYLSRELGIPKDFGAPVLCDFGSAVPLDDGVEHREDIQPDIYRSPEVILDIPWTYKVDIWNVGCMIWDAFEGEHLLTGCDPELNVYRGRAHLAEMIALLGPPPQNLLARAGLAGKFFSEQGEFSAGIPLPRPRPLEERETSLLREEDKEDRELFLRFMRKMLQWEPEQRSWAHELAEDEWILRHGT